MSRLKMRRWVARRSSAVMAAMVEATGRYDIPLAIVGAVLVFHHAAFVMLARRRRRGI